MRLQGLKRVMMFAVLAASTPAHAADLSLDIRRIEGPGWRAAGIELQLIPRQHLHLRIATIESQGRMLLKNLSLVCRELSGSVETRCEHAALKAESPLLGKIAVTLRFSWRDPRHWKAALALRDFSFSEPSGRYASEKLSAQIGLSAQGERWTLSLETQGGQAYAEPVFADFGALPMRLDAMLSKQTQGWALQTLTLALGKAGRIEASGVLDAAFKPQQLKARLSAEDLAPLAATLLQPFLIGGKLDGLALTGRVDAQLKLDAGAVQALDVQLDGAGFKADKLGVALEGLAGEAHWSPDDAAASTLRWSGGALQRVALGASAMKFRAQGREFELLEPLRQPLLEGALKVQQLRLRDLGGAQLNADFEGELEPLDLAALCRAFGWPEFSGTLAGRLPGLSVREDVWTIQGALQAQLFDGSLRIENLQAVQPFGVLPRMMADVELRRLDLERLTSTFSFGRITGRLDGDVKNLRLLNWSPVAFDGRLYSTPGDDGTRRISQRAVDNISAIGGGPTGVLSRGVMRFFEDFGYDSLGLSCTLRDGVCAMGGAEAAGESSYYLVKGAWLPRIDVVGYARRVSWATLLSQLKSAVTSGGPSLGAPP